MPNFSRMWQSRPVQLGLAGVGIIGLVVSSILLIRLFNPAPVNPANEYAGVFTGSTSNGDETVEGAIDTDSFPAEYLDSVGDIVYAPNGDAYFTNQNLNQIFLLRDGTAEVFAGTGEQGWRDGPVAQAKFTAPTALDMDSSNNLYIADRGNHRIRVIDLEEQTVVTLAGAGEIQWGPGGLSDGSRSTALFNQPNGLAVSPNGNLYVADSGNNAIRLITGDGVTTVAGSLEAESGFADGPGTDALFKNPRGIKFLNDTTLLIADTGNNRIRALNITDNTVSNFAGSGRLGVADGTAEEAQFNNPTDIEIASNGTVFITDGLNHLVRAIPLDNRVYSLAGTGSAGYRDGPLNEAQFNNPTAISESNEGALLVVDTGNKTIRQLR